MSVVIHGFKPLHLHSQNYVMKSETNRLCQLGAFILTDMSDLAMKGSHISVAPSVETNLEIPRYNLAPKYAEAMNSYTVGVASQHKVK